MTQPTESIAWEFALHQVQQFAGQVGAAKVFAYEPGDDEIAPETVYLEDDGSEIDYANFTAGRKQVNETITYTWQIIVVDRATVAATRVRVGELVAVITNAFQDDPSLGSFAGVLSAGVQSTRRKATQTPDGPIGWAEVVVKVQTRLH